MFEPVFTIEKQNIANLLEHQILKGKGICQYNEEQLKTAQESDSQTLCYLSFDYSEYNDMLTWLKEYLMQESLSYFFVKLHSSSSCPMEINDFPKLGDVINSATPTLGKGLGYGVVSDLKKEMEIFLFMVK